LESKEKIRVKRSVPPIKAMVQFKNPIGILLPCYKGARQQTACSENMMRQSMNGGLAALPDLAIRQPVVGHRRSSRQSGAIIWINTITYSSPLPKECWRKAVLLKSNKI